jgi:hypothetical protein
MKTARRAIRWKEGQVDQTQQHFELRYGSAKGRNRGEWTPAALVGRPVAGVLVVQFLIEEGDSRKARILKETKEDIQFMCELNEPDHWNYFKYHCTTASNLYCDIHWSFFDPGNERSVSEDSENSPSRTCRF